MGNLPMVCNFIANKQRGCLGNEDGRERRLWTKGGKVRSGEAGKNEGP